MLRTAANTIGLNTYSNLTAFGSKAEKPSEKSARSLKTDRSDDYAVELSISQKMRNQVRSVNVANKKSQDGETQNGQSQNQTSDGEMDKINELLKHQKELTIYAMKDTNTTIDRQKIHQEISLLSSEIAAAKRRTKLSSISALAQGASRITDTDMAREMMGFTKTGVLQQAEISMLAQANQSPQKVLDMLK